MDYFTHGAYNLQVSDESKTGKSSKPVFFDAIQTTILLNHYENKYHFINAREKKRLARRTELTEEQVAHWFANRRARTQELAKKEPTQSSQSPNSTSSDFLAPASAHQIFEFIRWYQLEKLNEPPETPSPFSSIFPLPPRIEVTPQLLLAAASGIMEDFFQNQSFKTLALACASAGTATLTYPGSSSPPISSRVLSMFLAEQNVGPLQKANPFLGNAVQAAFSTIIVSEQKRTVHNRTSVGDSEKIEESTIKENDVSEQE